MRPEDRQKLKEAMMLYFQSENLDFTNPDIVLAHAPNLWNKCCATGIDFKGFSFPHFVKVIRNEAAKAQIRRWTMG